MKGLMRKRSTTAARLQRAFSAKGSRGQQPDGLNATTAYYNHTNISYNNNNTNASNNNSFNNSSIMNNSSLSEYSGANYSNGFNTTSQNGAVTSANCHDVGTECMSPPSNGNHMNDGGNQHGNYFTDNQPTTSTPVRTKRHFIMETPVQFTTVSTEHNFAFQN